MTAEIALVVVGVLALLLWITLAHANRIDLLHQKVSRTGATLDAQLLRRAGLSAELAASGRLDPASSLLLASAADAALSEALEADLDADRAASAGGHREPGRATLTPEREVVESDLTRVLRAVLEQDEEDPSFAEDQLVVEVTQASHRVGLARRFHNDAVMQTRRVRLKPGVRLFRLAGHARMPRTFEMDDAVD
ncbi:hypothetical protein EDD28_3040 [Salana multivorans]|uniref:LemA protein n=1 Tax=Salana multivorans TaxID=120377 RepID=A0A3N2D1G3_9MICO|nr:hypothetical protein [Salana multivorans]MBN8880967.1 hypothetical protein [Salana multivorans]OJX94392.1 MAG: hypothetical protein BGO96_15985 [Micrococcales bacterium 73-15]ROR93622.1 hypothetical protein EDD28_3040 [Salana multivorans]